MIILIKKVYEIQIIMRIIIFFKAIQIDNLIIKNVNIREIAVV